MSSHYLRKKNIPSQERKFVPDRAHISPTFLQKRADCTGTSCNVSKKSSSNVTVAVAVAVPIGAILIILSIVLIVVYKRSKRGSLIRDKHSNLEADLYYLPKMGSSINSAKSEGSAAEKRFIYGSYDDFPSIDNLQSFKDYVRKIHDQAPSAYNIASLASQNNSRVSFPSKHTELPSKLSTRSIKTLEVIAASSTLRSHTEDNHGQGRDNLSSFDVRKEPGNKSDDQLQLHQTSSDGAEQKLSKEEEETIDRIRSIYNVYFEKSNSTLCYSTNSSLRRGRDSKLVLPTIEINNINSQENLNDTTTLADQSRFESANAKEIDTSSSASDEYEDAAEYLQVQAPQKSNHIVSSIYSELAFKNKNLSEPTFSTTISPPDATSTRVASSIYSEGATKIQAHSSKVHVRVPPLKISARPEPTHLQKLPVCHSNGYNQRDNSYGYYNYSPSSLEHPQNFENIGELPTPTQLAYSTSSHSLTSFKGRLKPPKVLKNVHTARLNGTALNPMDHPEMFYSTPAEKALSASLTKQPCMPLPYQLRHSVVMTNASDLSVRTCYKPAGSLSNLLRAQHLVNDSSATTSSPSLQQPSTIPATVNVRVSGLLDDSDVLQPPSVGNILPFNVSADELRKQLGSSHNYEIIS